MPVLDPDGKKGTDDDKPAFLDRTKGDSKDKDKGDASKDYRSKRNSQAVYKKPYSKNESTIKEGGVKKMMMADAENEFSGFY